MVLSFRNSGEAVAPLLMSSCWALTAVYLQAHSRRPCWQWKRRCLLIALCRYETTQNKPAGFFLQKKLREPAYSVRQPMQLPIQYRRVPESRLQLNVQLEGLICDPRSCSTWSAVGVQCNRFFQQVISTVGLYHAGCVRGKTNGLKMPCSSMLSEAILPAYVGLQDASCRSMAPEFRVSRLLYFI